MAKDNFGLFLTPAFIFIRVPTLKSNFRMEKLQYYIVGASQCKIFHKDTSSFIFRFIKSKLVVGCNDFP